MINALADGETIIAKAVGQCVYWDEEVVSFALSVGV